LFFRVRWTLSELLPLKLTFLTSTPKTRKLLVVEGRDQLECDQWPLTLKKKLGQGQGHPPFWAKIQIFNFFIKANFKVLNCFLSLSAHYHNLKKKIEAPSGIRTRVAWVMRSGHTTPASHIWCIDDHGTPVGYPNPVFLQLYRDWNDRIDKMDSATKLSRCNRKHAKWKDLSIGLLVIIIIIVTGGSLILTTKCT
jgi:hypothetical protein